MAELSSQVIMWCRNQGNVNRHWRLHRCRGGEWNPKGIVPPQASAPPQRGCPPATPPPTFTGLKARPWPGHTGAFLPCDTFSLHLSRAVPRPMKNCKREQGLIHSMAKLTDTDPCSLWSNSKSQNSENQKTYWSLKQNYLTALPGLNWHEAICSLYPT